ncbi:hypothetical protein Pse7367_1289 [Thalassoporum mexicanum PCC 7367]|uniref:LapA family protein n=1 Tax=Thalassoporum mexicanum TaxID=3457544 RepID=UPI00029FABB1|nr:LapA family protein [Pseudanabaena sp. PCC 7367]AFY69583.1 hypothetical protein Pse7367_1289 [Pseudanabaena sp. PCC 7367]
MTRNRNRQKSKRKAEPFPIFRFGLLATAIAGLAALVLQNLANSITLSFLGFVSISMPLSLAMIAAFVSGAISAYVINLFSFWLGGDRQPERSSPVDFDPPPSSTSKSGNSNSYNSYERQNDRESNNYTTIQADQQDDYDIYYEPSAAVNDVDDVDDSERPDVEVVYSPRINRSNRSSASPSSDQMEDQMEDRLDDRPITDFGRDRDNSGREKNIDEWVDGNFYGGRTPYKREDLPEEEMREYPPKQRPDGYDEYYDADQVAKVEPEDYLEAKYIRRGDEES